jgi:hypothetical protein
MGWGEFTIITPCTVGSEARRIPGLLRLSLSVSPPLQPLSEAVCAAANADGLPTEA